MKQKLLCYDHIACREGDDLEELIMLREVDTVVWAHVIALITK